MRGRRAKFATTAAASTARLFGHGSSAAKNNTPMIHRRPLFALAIAVMLLPGPPAAAARAAAHGPLVATADGWLRGLPRPGGGAEFLGIPYAQPPVGPLRWRAPRPVKSWRGVRPAVAFGQPCAQPPLGPWNQRAAATGRENCLFLNVIAPHWPVKKPLPVMFWIHGGANIGGSGVGPLYNAGTLVDHGVVLVTINYRLGIFGFLAAPALSRESRHHASGDYGLMDQILALKWVRSNIARFGGDPHDITVFGQSAGGTDTGLLMASRARGLFQRAIEESGTPFIPPVDSLRKAERDGARLLAALGVPPGAAGIAALRKLPAHALIAKMATLPRGKLAFPQPDVDGWVIPRVPLATFAAGREAPVPLLFGTTTREMNFPMPVAMIRATIRSTTGPLAPRVLVLYGFAHGGQGTSSPEYGSGVNQWLADVTFRCPAVLEARWHTAGHHIAYEYQFDHPLPGQPFAVHSSELPYVFGFFPGPGTDSDPLGESAAPFTRADHSLSRLMERYWTNFARSGDPNGPGLPEWPAFGARQRYIQFLKDGHVALASHIRRAQCSLFRAAMQRLMRRRIH